MWKCKHNTTVKKCTQQMLAIISWIPQIRKNWINDLIQYAFNTINIQIEVDEDGIFHVCILLPWNGSREWRSLTFAHLMSLWCDRDFIWSMARGSALNTVQKTMILMSLILDRQRGFMRYTSSRRREIHEKYTELPSSWAKPKPLPDWETEISIRAYWFVD